MICSVLININNFVSFSFILNFLVKEIYLLDHKVPKVNVNRRTVSLKSF